MLYPGEVVGLLGPNGSGKTTAMNLISGALPVNGGEIVFNGKPIHPLKSHQIARLGVARTFQLVKVLGSMTCTDNVIAGMAFKPRPVQQTCTRYACPATAGAGGSGRICEYSRRRNHLYQPRSAWSWPARWRWSRRSCCSTNGWQAWMPELQQGIALIRQLQTTGLTILMDEHVMDVRAVQPLRGDERWHKKPARRPRPRCSRSPRWCVPIWGKKMSGDEDRSAEARHA